MGFKAKIVEHRSPGIDSDEGFPSYFLDDDFATKEAALVAAAAHVDRLLDEKQMEPGAYSWDVCAAGGRSVLGVP